jgi:hypothetical protein
MRAMSVRFSALYWVNKKKKRSKIALRKSAAVGRRAGQDGKDGKSKTGGRHEKGMVHVGHT